jgi:hypothetical protein
MVQLYTSTPDAPAPWFIVDQIRRLTGQQVQVLPLSALRPPDKTHRQQLRTELVEAQNRLSFIRYLIGLAEQDAWNYAEELRQLRQDRDRHMVLVAALESQLRGEEGGQEL